MPPPSKSYSDLEKYFGIRDQNPDNNIRDIENLNIFSTNIFIPMNSNFSYKKYLYVTGFIKLVETFLARTTKLNTIEVKGSRWMLFIYYDQMFDQDYNDTAMKDVYESKNNNNEFNKALKTSYSKNKNQLQLLLQLNKRYIDHIKSHPDTYHFVKLYSFNCDELKKKFKHADGSTKKYLGHPDTFGSIVRFLPLFNPHVLRTFCINISHAISPKLVDLVEKWIKSKQSICTNDYNGYDYPLGEKFFKNFIKICYRLKNTLAPGDSIEIEFRSRHDDTEIQKNIVEKLLYKKRLMAGIFGYYKNKYLPDSNYPSFNINLFYYIVEQLVFSQDFKTNFKYGVDEYILGFIVNNSDQDKIYTFTNKTHDMYFFKKTNTINLLFSNYFYIRKYIIELLSLLFNRELELRKQIYTSFPFKKREIISFGGGDVLNDGNEEYKFTINIKYNSTETEEEINKTNLSIAKIKKHFFDWFIQNTEYKARIKALAEDNFSSENDNKNHTYIIGLLSKIFGDYETQNDEDKEKIKRFVYQALSENTIFTYYQNKYTFELTKTIEYENHASEDILKQYHKYNLVSLIRVINYVFEQ
jgi:hypothetical protein